MIADSFTSRTSIGGTILINNLDVSSGSGDYYASQIAVANQRELSLYRRSDDKVSYTKRHLSNVAVSYLDDNILCVCDRNGVLNVGL